MKPKFTTTLLAVSVSIVLTACQPKEAAAPQAQLPLVETATLVTAPITPYVQFIGRTIAANHIEIIPHVGGELTAIHFKDGEFVQKDQLLYEIDARPYEAKLKSAKAALAKAKANLNMASRNATRARKLIRNNSISESQFDATIAEFETAKASVSVEEANVTEAALNLDYTKIRAPFAGRVGFSQYKVGDRITTVVKNRLVSLSQIDPMRFNFDVDEKLYRQIRDVIDAVKAKNKTDDINVDISLTLSNGKVHPVKGEIYAVDNQIDPTTGSIHVQASFDNQDYALVPGEYGKIDIKLNQDMINGILVPQSAISQDQAGSYVMVVDKDQVVKPKYVELGQTYGADQSIMSGVDAGETIVVKGLQKIRAGVKVQTKPAQAGKTAAAKPAPTTKGE